MADERKVSLENGIIFDKSDEQKLIIMVLAFRLTMVIDIDVSHRLLMLSYILILMLVSSA